MLEKLAKSIEEVNVLAEHYRICQNVAAIESLVYLEGSISAYHPDSPFFKTDITIPPKEKTLHPVDIVL